MYSAREMQRQGSMACASFEDLKRRIGAGGSGRSIYVDVEQGHYEVGI